MTFAIEREAVTIQNRKGQTLYGVVTRPALGGAPACRKVVLFSQAGLQSKSGVGDYFRWLGDELSARGYTVARFDQSGTGDSAGELVQDVPLQSFFLRIQHGAFKEDIQDMMAWIRKALRPEQLYLWGQCGGCVSTTLACAEKPEGVSGLVMLAPPVLFLPEQETVREHDALIARRGYLHKLLNPQSYLRFLRGQSEYNLIKAAALSYLRQLKNQARQQLDRWRKVALPDHPLFNWPFWEAFQAVMRQKKPVLFQMAELDNETPEFEREFRHKVLEKRPDYLRLCAIQYLEKADHSLMFESSRLESRELLLGWLTEVGHR